MTDQLSIPVSLQPRNHKRQDSRLYARVLLLRKRGFTVHRCGFDRHKVNGAIWTSRQLRWAVEQGLTFTPKSGVA